MKRYTLIVLMALLLLLSFGSCSRKGRVIPEKKLADIYAEMFLADQWMNTNYAYKRAADTTLFYEPIFEKYGYNLEDFNESMRFYVKKPDKYAKILKTAALKLDAQAKRLKKVEDYYNNRETISPYIAKNFNLNTLMSEDTMMTLCVRDIYNSIFQKEVPVDTLAAEDSLLVKDSLVLVDKEVRDSVASNVLKVEKDSILTVNPREMRPSLMRAMGRPVDSMRRHITNTKMINDNE